MDDLANRLGEIARQKKKEIVEQGGACAQLCKGKICIPSSILGHIASFCISRTCKNNLGLTCVAALWAVRNANDTLLWPTEYPSKFTHFITTCSARLMMSKDGSKIFHASFRPRALEVEIWDRLVGFQQATFDHRAHIACGVFRQICQSLHSETVLSYFGTLKQ